MMNGWEAEGIQYTHTDLGLDDTVNVPDFLVRSTTWRLVPELAQEYLKVLTDAQRSDVTDALNALQSYFTPAPMAQTDEGIVNRRRATYGNITRA
jgi:type VI protein secretion system component VasA